MQGMQRYLDLFLSEAREHLNAAYELESRVTEANPESQPVDDLLRHTHSIKGMAATLGFGSMVSLTHALEDELARIRDGAHPHADDFPELLRAALACVGTMLDRIEHGKLDDSIQASSITDRLRSETEDTGGTAPDESAPGRPSSEDDDRRGSGSAPVWRVELQLDERSLVSTVATVALLRRVTELGRIVSADPPLPSRETGRFSGRLRFLLDSESSRAEIEGVLGGYRGIAQFSVTACARPGAPRETSAGPSRWVRVRAELLDDLVGDLRALRQQHGRLQAEIPGNAAEAHHRLMGCEFRLRKVYGVATRLRLVRFDFMAHRLHQTVHEFASRLGKDVDFRILGGSVSLDRGVLDTLVEPLMHLIKNSLDHGLESPEDRQRAGKPRRGALRLRLDRRANRVLISVEDDGRGMVPERMRNRAVELGLIQRRDADRLDDEASLLLVTRPGFTTRPRASHVSGRGVGLDVAQDAVRGLGGSMRIQSTPGRGCRFTLSMPPGQALIRALLVRSAGGLYALPINAVQRTIDLECMDSDGFRAGTELVFLHDRLGVRRFGEAHGRATRALILAGQGVESALVVDDVLGRQDVILQPLEGPLAHLAQFSGAALTDDGTIALVLDPSSLLRMATKR